MDYRSADSADLPRLAAMNRALIEDEGAANRMSLGELEARMRGWLAGEYRAVIFEIDGAPVGYALFRPDESGVHLRQLFVDRAHRRQGLGREALRRLQAELWPAGARISVEVLVGNARGLAFWRAVGFADHAITLTSTPKPAGGGGGSA
jgi:GNAT superfamily N-acetyltransferase